MRVYFLGSHSTGKTTLARYVSERYKLPLVTEVARTIMSEMEAPIEALRTNLALIDQYQTAVFERQVAVEKQQGANYVSDRAFDNLAYAAEHATVLAKVLATKRFKDYVKWVSTGMVFFVRPHRRLLKDDGIREAVEWDSVVRIDGMIKLLLEMHEVPYVQIDSPNHQERTRLVNFLLSRRNGLQ